MKSHAWEQILTAGTAVLTAAGDMPQAVAAIGSGVQLIDLWQAGNGTADAVRDRYPGVPLCARADWAALTRDPAAALRTGALLICAGTAAAEHAGAAGVARGRILVEAPPDRAAGLLAAGWAVIVTADDRAGPHAAAALGAIACWLGAAAVRTGHGAAVRRAIAMTTAIKAGAGWSPGGCALP
ncbi:MAG TPA: hypothetical protein VGM53_12965 [Streptosporangiaceae bacterium]